MRDFFGQMVNRPPWQKVSRTPMVRAGVGVQFLTFIPLMYNYARLGSFMKWFETPQFLKNEESVDNKNILMKHKP